MASSEEGDFRARHSVHFLRMASSEERIFARGLQFTVCAWHRPRGLSRAAFSSLFAHGIVGGADVDGSGLLIDPLDGLPHRLSLLTGVGALRQIHRPRVRVPGPTPPVL